MTMPGTPPSLKALESSRDKSSYQLEEAQADKHLALEQLIKLQAGRNLCQSMGVTGAWAGNLRRAVDVLQCH